MSALLPAPVPPEDWECCGSECGDACVWELYYRDCAVFKAQQAEQPEPTASPRADRVATLLANSHEQGC